MNLLNRLEKKFGKYAIHNFMMYIITGNIITFILGFFDPMFNSSLVFNLDKVMHGEIWRIVTFIFLPPNSSPIFIIFALMFYYFLGNSVEKYWGAFKFNIYYLSGCLFSIAGAVVYSLLTGSTDITVTGFYVNLSLLLAFASIYPNYEIMIYFVLPVKIKWIAYLDVFFLGLQMIVGQWSDRLMIVLSLLNFIAFFGPGFFKSNKQQVKTVQRRTAYNQEIKKSGHKHVCSVCGKTDDDSDLEFRFCSKCEGHYEYCSEHLFTHEHKK